MVGRNKLLSTLRERYYRMKCRLKKYKYIFTGTALCGQKIYLEGTGKRNVDAAYKSVFHDWVHKTASLEMTREDVQIILEWGKKHEKGKC